MRSTRSANHEASAARLGASGLLIVILVPERMRSMNDKEKRLRKAIEDLYRYAENLQNPLNGPDF